MSEYNPETDAYIWSPNSGDAARHARELKTAIETLSAMELNSYQAKTAARMLEACVRWAKNDGRDDHGADVRLVAMHEDVACSRATYE